MVDFNDMAAKAKAAAQARIAETLADQGKKADESKRVHDSAVAALRAHVLPLLGEAKADFAKQGIPAVIRESFDVARPYVTITCKGPDVPNAYGGKRTPESIAAVFSCQDEFEIKVSVTERPGPGHPHAEMARVEPRLVLTAATQALERVLNSYTDELHRAHTER